jgi:hypothetical protein
VYRDAYKQVTSILNIKCVFSLLFSTSRIPISLKELGEKFRCPKVGDMAVKALARYVLFFTSHPDKKIQKGFCCSSPGKPASWS